MMGRAPRTKRGADSARLQKRLRVNGVDHDLEVGPCETLLDILRNRLGLTGSKEGCARGECGACAVLVAGMPILSCISLAVRVDGEVVTIEGIAERYEDLRRAFAEHGGFQCGFCTPGQLVCASKLLSDAWAMSDADVRRAMSGNICRCTGYVGIIRAVVETASHRAAEGAS